MAICSLRANNNRPTNKIHKQAYSYQKHNAVDFYTCLYTNNPTRKMDVLYYSNHCKHCQKLLAHLAKICVLDKYNFVCIDRRSIDPNTRQISITLDRGVKTVLPPNVSRVPTLLLVNKKFTAIVGDDIYQHVNTQVKHDPAATTSMMEENGGEPIGYIISPSSGGVNIVSETYTMYNAPPEELAGKGTGSTRQMHNYVSASMNALPSIPTPLEESAPRAQSKSQSNPIYQPTSSQSQNSLYPNANNIPTNPSTYNAYSVPGVSYNTGQIVVPELQRPPAHRHTKLGEDTTIDSLQQKRNIDLNNSLPFIAKQLNSIISPEISNIQPPDRQG